MRVAQCTRVFHTLVTLCTFSRVTLPLFSLFSQIFNDGCGLEANSDVDDDEGRIMS
eukprot:m.87028 g.87028  ORF g.87028 m.87028 type:complete len:56 (-) comp26031_c0_seq1:33-200(-)